MHLPKDLQLKKTSNLTRKQRKGYISEVISNLISLNKFFKDSTNHSKTYRTVFCSLRPLPNLPKYRDKRWDFPTA